MREPMVEAHAEMESMMSPKEAQEDYLNCYHAKTLIFERFVNI